MSEDQLRSALAALDAPAAAPRSGYDALSAFRRRRARRRWTALVGAATTAVLVVAVIVWSPWIQDVAVPGDPDPTTGTSGAWTPIAPAPISGRTGAASVWTGSEMLVVGGTSATCPAGASCVGPDADDLVLDGAAYDPATDAWRPIAAPPVPILSFQRPVWTGREMVLLTPVIDLTPDGGAEFRGAQVVLAFDPAADRWRELATPPSATLAGGIVVGEKVLFWQDDDSRGGGDWLLDPTTDSWTELAEPPLPPSFARSYAWTGERLVLAGLPIDGGPTFRLASFDLATQEWTELPESPVTSWGVTWFAVGSVVVNPSQQAAAAGQTTDVSGALDLRTGSWSAVPQVSADDLGRACALPSVGLAGAWLVTEPGALVSLDPAVAIAAPPCDGQEPTAAVWTGEALIAWGGVDALTQTALNLDGWTWTPPEP